MLKIQQYINPYIEKYKLLNYHVSNLSTFDKALEKYNSMLNEIFEKNILSYDEVGAINQFILFLFPINGSRTNLPYERISPILEKILNFDKKEKTLLLKPSTLYAISLKENFSPFLNLNVIQKKLLKNSVIKEIIKHKIEPYFAKGKIGNINIIEKNNILDSVIPRNLIIDLFEDIYFSEKDKSQSKIDPLFLFKVMEMGYQVKEKELIGTFKYTIQLIADNRISAKNDVEHHTNKFIDILLNNNIFRHYIYIRKDYKKALLQLFNKWSDIPINTQHTSDAIKKLLDNQQFILNIKAIQKDEILSSMDSIFTDVTIKKPSPKIKL